MHAGSLEGQLYHVSDIYGIYAQYIYILYIYYIYIWDICGKYMGHIHMHMYIYIYICVCVNEHVYCTLIGCMVGDKRADYIDEVEVCCQVSTSKGLLERIIIINYWCPYSFLNK